MNALGLTKEEQKEIENAYNSIKNIVDGFGLNFDFPKKEVKTKHSETLYKIATILDDAKIDNCKIDAEDMDNGIIIHVTPIIDYKCGDYVELWNNKKGIIVFHDKILIKFYDERGYDLTTIIRSNISRKLSRTEIIEVNEKLTLNGKKFNHEKLKLEKLPPRSKKGEVFYCMSRTFECLKSTDNRDETSNKLYDSGNYFLESVNCKEFIKRVIKNR